MRPPGVLSLVTLIGFFRSIDRSQGGLYDTLDQNWAGSAKISLSKAKDFRDSVLCTIKKQECRKKNVDKNIICDIQHGYEGTDTSVQDKEEYLNASCQEEPVGNVSLSHFRCLLAKILNYTITDCGDYGIVCDIYSGLSPTSTASPTPTPGKPTSAAAPPTPPDKTPRPDLTTLETPDGITAGPQTDKPGTEGLLRSLLAVSLSLNVVLPLAVYLVMCCQRRRRRRRAQ